jgi:hypothetical protein
MSAESLLLWMSARVQGSWPQFRGAIEQLQLNQDDGGGAPSGGSPALPVYSDLRLTLQRLAHVEFYAGAGENDWRVAPPCIAATRSAAGAIGVLTGARSQKLLGRLSSAAGSALEVSAAENCPDCIRVIGADCTVLENIAAAAGIMFQNDATICLLCSLPSLESAGSRPRCELPFGDEWRVKRFSPSKLHWSEALPGEVQSARLSLFCFSRRHERLYYLCHRGMASKVSGSAGKYLALKHRRRRIISYDAATMRLSIPAICRPPVLIERALNLCSGTLPAYERRGASPALLHYSGISASVARLVFSLLRQEPR